MHLVLGVVAAVVGVAVLYVVDRGVPSVGALMDAAKLLRVMPGLGATRAAMLAPSLVHAMVEARIDSPLRVAAFLAQLGHESGSLLWFEELGDGQRYEGRRDLGNVQPGDGPRFKGRGPIQLTGRTNYAAASLALGVDLVAVPSRAAEPETGFRVAAWYWTSRGLNALADVGTQASFDEITRRINGGLNGKVDRDRRYAMARSVLGLEVAS